mmetsp:Transcript_12025/g.14691  ORF Transcript_12025/g.14691 Transcript_12025/m.14691 type:complete len:115 (+) Transcript_12025:65-409(+)
MISELSFAVSRMVSADGPNDSESKFKVAASNLDNSLEMNIKHIDRRSLSFADTGGMDNILCMEERRSFVIFILVLLVMNILAISSSNDGTRHSSTFAIETCVIIEEHDFDDEIN